MKFNAGNYSIAREKIPWACFWRYLVTLCYLNLSHYRLCSRPTSSLMFKAIFQTSKLSSGM